MADPGSQKGRITPEGKSKSKNKAMTGEKRKGPGEPQALLTSFFSKKATTTTSSSSPPPKEDARTTLEAWERRWSEGTEGLSWDKTGRGSDGGRKVDAEGVDEEETSGESASETEPGVRAAEKRLVEMAHRMKEESGRGADGSGVGAAVEEKDGDATMEDADESNTSSSPRTLPQDIQDAGKRQDTDSPCHAVSGSRSRNGKCETWDNRHVKLPCSIRNVFVQDGQLRWEVIQTVLTHDLRCFEDIKRCILSYSAEYGTRYSFDALKSFLNEGLADDERTRFFNTVLPGIRELAMLLPQVCPVPIPLLLEGRSKVVALSQLQCASLLSNAFFCTFPHKKRVEGDFPSINFFDLFEGRNRDRIGQSGQKLRCLVEYFDQICRRRAGGDALSRQVEFHRRYLGEEALEWATGSQGNEAKSGGLQWLTSGKKFGEVDFTVRTDDMIENFDPTGEVWQADFANSYIGGGVIGSGCVQEEIRFLLSPELIVSRLLATRMGNMDSILVVGTERFCDSTGYASTFRFAGSHRDKAEVDDVGKCLKTSVICFDALYFSSSESQFTQQSVTRELNKALCAFLPPDAFPHCNSEGRRAFASDLPRRRRAGKTPAIATGNWGCGAFGGDHILKALVQIVAAAQSGKDIPGCFLQFSAPNTQFSAPNTQFSFHFAERHIFYMTFGDAKLSKQLEDIFRVLVETNAKVRVTLSSTRFPLIPRLTRFMVFMPGGHSRQGFDRLSALTKFWTEPWATTQGLRDQSSL